MNKKKPNRVVIRMTNEMLDRIIEIAEIENATQSDVIRYLVEEGLKVYEK